MSQRVENAQSADPRVGSTVDGKFTLIQRIACSPLGDTYRAEACESGATIEVRFITSEWLEALNYWDLCDIVETRMSVAATLTHSNVDPVVFSGISDGQGYVAFAGDSSFTLRSFLSEQGGIPLLTAREVATQVLKALNAAHQAGLVHLDLCPENILLTVDESGDRLVRVRGFGIAKVVAGTENNLSLMTKSAQTVSGPEYMSPEMFTGKPTDARSDLYSLGVIFYEMVEGKVPFQSDSLIDMLLKHLHEPLPPFSSATSVVPGADSVFEYIQQLMQKAPNQRPSTAADCIELLEKIAPISEKEPEKEPAKVELVETSQSIVPNTDDSVVTAKPKRGTSLLADKVWMIRAIFGLLFLNCIVLLAVLVSVSKDRAQKEATSPLRSAAKRVASAPSVQGADSKIAVPSTGEAADQSPAETGDSRAALKTTSEPGPIVSIPSLGIEVRQIDRTTTTKWGLRNAEGLLVEKVDRKGVAFKAGLRSRDIIQKFETKGENILSWRPVPVRTAKALTLGIQEASEHDRRLALIIKRGSFDGLVVFISAPKK